MFIKKAFLFLVFTGVVYNSAYSQQDDFCDALTTIIRDAPNKFRNIKGKFIQSDMNSVVYACGIKVPGTIDSRFVVSMGLFYEGALIQTRKKEDLKPVYEKYQTLLMSCLGPQGYVLTSSDNFYPGLQDYKKLVIMQEIKDEVKADAAPPHLTLEAMYDKESKKYTIVMYVFEH